MKKFMERYREIVNSSEHKELNKKISYENKIRLLVFLILAPTTFILALSIEHFFALDNRIPSWCAVVITFIASYVGAAYFSCKKFNNKEK